MNEVPLYIPDCFVFTKLLGDPGGSFLPKVDWVVQGYLAHKKLPPPRILQ